MSDIDINLIVLWNKVTTQFLEHISSVPPYEVDLSFEVHNYSHVNSYSSGETIYIADLVFNDKLELNISIPNGDTNKFVPFKFFDIISHYTNADDTLNRANQNLMETIKNCYVTAFFSFEIDESLKLPATIEEFFADIKKVEDKHRAANILNNGGEYVKEVINAEKDIKAFGEMDDFGTF